MATYPTFSYYPHKVYSIRENSKSYKGHVIGEGIGPNGLPVYVMIADTQDQNAEKRYIITAWCQYANSTKYVFIEYKSPTYSLQSYVASMSQTDMDMAFNELARLENESTTENLDEGHYSLKDMIEFSNDYQVFKSATFTHPDKVIWSADENTISGPFGDFTFEVNDGYSIQLERETPAGGQQFESTISAYRGDDMTGSTSMSSTKPITLLGVQTPDESIDPSTGDETDDFTLRERTPTIIKDESLEGLPQSRIWIEHYPADPDAVWPDKPDEYWTTQYDLGSEWSSSLLPRTKSKTTLNLADAETWFDHIKRSAEGIDRQEEDSVVLKSEVGMRWIHPDVDNIEEQQIQAAVWHGLGIKWRVATDSILTDEQLSEGIQNQDYGWLSMGATASGSYSTDIGQGWIDKWNGASTDAEKITVFDEFWSWITTPPSSEELQNMTFKSLWEHHLEVDPDNSIIEGDETGDTPFKQFLLEDMEQGVSWITDNMLSVNKSAKRVSIVAARDSGLALRITPPSGMNLNLGNWGKFVKDWNADIGSMVLFFEGGNGITIENGEMTIKHNNAKSIHPFTTSLRTSSWGKHLGVEGGDTYPEWQDNGDRLFFPDDDANTDESNAVEIKVRDGWSADVELETENMSYFTEHFKKAGEPITFENDRWSKTLTGGDRVVMDQDNEKSGFKNGFHVETTSSSGSERTYGTDEAVNDEVWIGFSNMIFEKYRGNEPSNFEQAVIRGIYPFEFSLNDDAFTIELVQIYDTKISEDRQALEWGTTNPQDAPPQDDDGDSSADDEEGGFNFDSGWILGIGIVVLLFVAIRFTGSTIGD